MSEAILKGITLSEGIAIGKAMFFNDVEENYPKRNLGKNEIEGEISRFKKAVASSRNDIKKLQKNFTKQGILEIVEILNSHLEMLYDPWLMQQVEEKIKKLKINSEAVFKTVLEEFKKKCSDDSFFSERYKDVLDVSKRILKHLTSRQKLNANIKNGIVLTHEIIPSDIAEADEQSILAFVTQKGGRSSHSAIIARAKNIPFIANVDIDKLDIAKLKKVIVDGINGKIIFNPSKSTIKKYEQLKKELKVDVSGNEKINTALQTQDKVNIKIYGNIGSIQDVKVLFKNNAHGVGLFRSEYLFLAKKKLPSEEEQFKIYKELAQTLKNYPLIIRIFDFGADKNYIFSCEDKYSYLSDESNPALGCRGARFLLKHQEILDTQIRALLRASAFGNVHFLVPFVSDVSEFLRIKQRMLQIKEDLIAQKIKVAPDIILGCMIEVPSAAIMADAFAEVADFLSIGTNDLNQYLLAADCANANVSHFFNGLHPSLLRVLEFIVKAAEKKQKRVILCGEIAADKRFTKLLLGLGIKEFSVTARYIPLISHVIKNLSFIDAMDFFTKVKKISDNQQLQNYVINDS
ncbi:MAG: phosphoenolpyruvate--protein phosphotransferase [Chlamydiae bacterium]|nr:phosphoenolpyruvate--protein phosphotransferase [Chlamydiota bacterium]